MTFCNFLHMHLKMKASVQLVHVNCMHWLLNRIANLKIMAITTDTIVAHCTKERNDNNSSQRKAFWQYICKTMHSLNIHTAFCTLFTFCQIRTDCSSWYNTSLNLTAIKPLLYCVNSHPSYKT